jgi:tetratricopeptide (TPR) repeat protein
MHKLALLLVAVLIGFCSFGTKSLANLPPDTLSTVVDQAKALLLIDKGKTLFFEGKLKDALEEFRAAANRDPNGWQAPFWIAQTHYALGNYGAALKYAETCIGRSEDNLNKEIYELLGKAYHRTEKLDSALTNYKLANEKLSSLRAKELRIPLLIEQCEFAKKELSKGEVSLRKGVRSLNTASPEYAPNLTNGGKELYFTSRRSNTVGGKMNPDDQEYFEDVYRGVWNEQLQAWDSISNQLGRINTSGFDALNYVSPDGTKALLTINTTAMEDPNPLTMGSDIFTMEKSNKNKWSTPKIIDNETINTSYFEGAATMTKDGNTLFFVTDRNGDKSALDIWMVVKSGKNWGEAVPAPFNTPGKETTPFVSADGKYLFFSSDGLPGMGGYDVYVVEKKGSTWGTPINLGGRINSVNNDTHFQYYPEWNKAMMVGYQSDGQKGSLDIYELDMNGFIIPTGK